MAAVSSEPITISLSFEELQVVLQALGNPQIPGLDNDPWVGLTPEQQNLALNVAWRGLEARGFARLDEDDQFRVHNALMTAVRTCASPRRTILVDRYAPDAQLSTLYAHTGGDGSVVHSGEG